MSFIVPNNWISSNGFLKQKAKYAIKLFFGDITLEHALKQAEKSVGYGWMSKGPIKMKKGSE